VNWRNVEVSFTFGICVQYITVWRSAARYRSSAAAATSFLTNRQVYYVHYYHVSNVGLYLETHETLFVCSLIVTQIKHNFTYCLADNTQYFSITTCLCCFTGDMSMQCKDRVQKWYGKWHIWQPLCFKGWHKESIAKALVTSADGAKLLKTADRSPTFLL
jgi:hypothetical protein